VQIEHSNEDGLFIPDDVMDRGGPGLPHAVALHMLLPYELYLKASWHEIGKDNLQ
jgi:hypothetical protein